MNRKETKLLVENWRKVLDEGLYDSDPEVLEEIFTKQNIIMGMLMASNFVSGITFAKPPEKGKSPAEVAAGLVSQIGAKGQDVPKKSTTIELSEEQIASRVNMCYSIGSALLKKKINGDKDLKSRFKEAAKHSKLSEVSLIKNFSIVIPRKMCVQHFNTLVKMLPEKMKNFPSDKDIDRFAIVLLLHVYGQEKYTEEDFDKAVKHVTTEISTEDVLRDFFKISGDQAAQRMFRRLVSEEGKENLEKLVINFLSSVTNREAAREAVEGNFVDSVFDAFLD